SADDLRNAWRYWLSLYNWLQVLPGVVLATRDGLGADDYSLIGLSAGESPSLNELAGAQQQEWNNICDGVFSILIPGIRDLQAQNITPPDEVGFGWEYDG